MDPYVGEIRAFAFDFPPVGWARCDGAQLSVATNQLLFAVIGTTYGGDGRSTFKLPDFRSAVPVGMGNGPGLTPRALGSPSVGSATVQLGGQHFAPHTHRVAGKDRTTRRTHEPGPEVFISNPGIGNYYAEVSSGEQRSPMAPTTIAPSGNAAAMPRNNEQPYQALNFCIALDGIYPPRP